jgi:MarR family transcriptional regulator, organic hydroperoxide resistance regulator
MYNWDFDDPYSDTWVLLQQSWYAISGYLQGELSDLGVTWAQTDILMILSASRAPLTTTQIAAYTFRSPQSVSELVSRMESAGFLKKFRGVGDQRVVKIRMTPKGEELEGRLKEAGFVYGSRVMKSSLSPTEVDQLNLLLRKLRDNVLREIALKTEPLPDILDKPRFRRQRP